MLKKSSITVVLCVVVALTECNKNTLEHPKDTLRIDIGAEPPTLDPNKSEDVNSGRIMQDLYARLVDYNQRNEIILLIINSHQVLLGFVQ